MGSRLMIVLSFYVKFNLTNIWWLWLYFLNIITCIFFKLLKWMLLDVHNQPSRTATYTLSPFSRHIFNWQQLCRYFPSYAITFVWHQSKLQYVHDFCWSIRHILDIAFPTIHCAKSQQWFGKIRSQSLSGDANDRNSLSHDPVFPSLLLRHILSLVSTLVRKQLLDACQSIIKKLCSCFYKHINTQLFIF